MRKVTKVISRCYPTITRNPHNTNLPLCKPSLSLVYYHHSKQYIQKSTVRKISSLPKTTWSLSELNLSSTISACGSSNDELSNHAANNWSNSKKKNRPPMSDVELDELAYRCLINVHILPSSDSDRLKSDLDNIMRCVSIVTDADNSNTTDYYASIGIVTNPHMTLDSIPDKEEEVQKASCDDGKSVATDYLKDHGGGFTVRSRTHEIEAWGAGDKLEAKDVLNRLRGSKMVVRQGGRKKGDGDDYLEDWYFSLVKTTKEEEER